MIQNKSQNIYLDVNNLMVMQCQVSSNKMSNYQLKTIKADLYNILVGTVKKLVHYENLQLYLRLGFKIKKKHCILEFNQSQFLKP